VGEGFGEASEPADFGGSGFDALASAGGFALSGFS
jgi:hypothetical protein